MIQNNKRKSLQFYQTRIVPMKDNQAFVSFKVLDNTIEAIQIKDQMKDQVEIIALDIIIQKNNQDLLWVTLR